MDADTQGPMSKDGTPEWAYDEDGYCVCCGNGNWKYHMPECELRDGLDAARLVADALDKAGQMFTIKPNLVGMVSGRKMLKALGLGS